MNILKKELLIASRSRQIQVCSIIIIVLLIAAGVGGYLNYKTQKSQIAQAQHEKREQWLNQGHKHPHIASHFGTFVFKPKTGLSFFDFGIDAYTGASIYLEAHYQHDFMFRQAQDYSAMIRFGELSIALVLQLLIPLLIIFLCFAAFTQERENGTLKIMISQGVSFSSIVWSKITTYALIVFAVLLPAVFLIMTGLFLTPELDFTMDVFFRCLVLLVLYLLYFFIFICLSVGVSSWSRWSGNALLVLLSVWIIFTIILPKLTASLAAETYELPSKVSFEAQVKADLDSRIKRDPSKDTLIVNFTSRLLRQYKVDSVAQLPINYEAAYAQMYEDFSNRLHDQYAAGLADKIISQNKLSGYTGMFNPFLSVRHLSMAMSGTDFYTYADFQRSAETYRRKMVRQMNVDYRDHSKTGEFYEYKAGRPLWRALADFHYAMPPLSSSLRPYLLELFSLLAWAIGLGLCVTYFVNKSVL